MDEMRDKQAVQRVIHRSLSGIQDDPWMAQRVLNMAHQQQTRGGIVVKKKLSTGFALMMAVILLGATALAATLLWQDAGEKLAPMERVNGYYDTWNAEAKTELIRTLCALGEMKDDPDVEKLLNSTDMADADRNALCDSIMSAYVNGTPDTVTMLSVLEKLHGDISTWPMEDKAWYYQLLEANGMLTAEDTFYMLPQAGQISQEQAIDAARTFLLSMGAESLENAQVEATMYEETDDCFYGETQVSQKGRCVWSVIFRQENETCQVDIGADGNIIGYSLPQLTALFVRGTLPDDTAIPKTEAMAIGIKALSDQVSQDELSNTKAFFGFIDLADEAAAHAKLGEHVWVIRTGQHYALVSPAGDVLFVGSGD